MHKYGETLLSTTSLPDRLIKQWLFHGFQRQADIREITTVGPTIIGLGYGIRECLPVGRSLEWYLKLSEIGQ